MEQTYGGTDWGGRERKDDDQTCFCLLPSFFPFTKVKVAQLGPFPRQSPLIQRRSRGEGTMRGLLLAGVGVTPPPHSAWTVASERGCGGYDSM